MIERIDVSDGTASIWTPARQAFVEGLSALKGRCELMEQACQDGHEASLERLWAKFEWPPPNSSKELGCHLW